VAGPRLLGNVRVAARIRELQARQSAKAEMSRDDLRRYLVSVMRTPCGEIGPEHPLWVMHRRTEGGLEVRMPDKLCAAELLAKLCGWLAPDKVQLEAGEALATLLQRIRSSRESAASA
jgi:hypothetical protein